MADSGPNPQMNLDTQEDDSLKELIEMAQGPVMGERTLRRPRKVGNRLHKSIYKDVVNEVGEAVLLIVIEWLYDGRKPPETYLMEYFSTDKEKKLLFTEEKDKLNLLKNREIELEDLGICTLYKLIQITCQLEKSEEYWSCKGREELKASLEHKLYILKENRNGISHVIPPELRNMSYEDLTYQIINVKDLFVEIIDLAGEKAKKSKMDVFTQKGLISIFIEDIYKGHKLPYPCELDSNLVNSDETLYDVDKFDNKAMQLEGEKLDCINNGSYNFDCTDLVDMECD